MSTARRIDLAPDQALPQRDLLLDPDGIARRFSARLGSRGRIEIDRCERLRIKYSPGASLRVLHRIRVGGSSYTIATRVFTGGRSESAFERAAASAVPCGPLLPVAHDRDLDAVCWTFPNDRKITSLSALANPPSMFAGIFTDQWARSRVVAYAPEKCVTAQCLSDSGNLLAYAKAYSEEERCSYDIYQALLKKISNAKSGLRIPRALIYSEEHRLLLLEPVAGLRIADLDDAKRPSGFHRLGGAIAGLHGLPVPDGLPRFERLDPDRLLEASQVVGRARPDVRELASKLAQELCDRRDALKEAEVCAHGDVHPKNGILQNDGVALIDLDQAGPGPAAADLGSLLAALRYCRCVGALSPAGEDELASAFLSGYGEVRELPPRTSLRWHMAAALLAERALRAVNRIREEGLKHMSELLLDSWNLLTEEGHE
ncbi:MAG TPA: aminoglycoside phosphotransferase family protein [Blastocatellia bacterium]|nr:aminoglycoside phosphotransferase family protein [Blastocatellia bacterium]